MIFGNFDIHSLGSSHIFLTEKGELPYTQLNRCCDAHRVSPKDKALVVEGYLERKHHQSEIFHAALKHKTIYLSIPCKLTGCLLLYSTVTYICFQQYSSTFNNVQ
jgi:hypothetical protein